ncbi:MAG: sulfotransferase domain-containing protein [Moorea sp. SIOASIH]|uniref:sulfotransferase domain-containing protein n=1 Tax=Moorena sp. SIOASIH TaxID=2607817 RepID=UPI0013BBEAE0|nr:sulfotransferase domain-containing protein [Moorena sp. SIOASIH]NEO36050.1 sulfotransferase domain-containing protein [Moorena sp. SIOASIH]NEO91153.1 sulfotransferase domain-containing protein [Moorena sp. SIO3G5]
MLENQAPRIIIKDQTRDSQIWHDISYRPTDIIVASAYKTGTTLTQQIINLIVHGSDNFESIHLFSPWVETLFAPIKVSLEKIEALPDRRILKTHLPFEALPYNREWKYIYLARDGRDIGLSLYNHINSYLDEIKNFPKDFTKFWDEWLETGEPCLYPLLEHIHSWWQFKHLPNLMLLHYDTIINHKSEVVDKIASFIGADLTPEIKQLVLDKSSLAYMKANWEKFQPPNLFKPKTFINKGVNGRWKGILFPEQIDRYEKLLAAKLEPECAAWVKNGGFIVY